MSDFKSQILKVLGVEAKPVIQPKKDPPTTKIIIGALCVTIGLIIGSVASDSLDIHPIKYIEDHVMTHIPLRIAP